MIVIFPVSIVIHSLDSLSGFGAPLQHKTFSALYPVRLTTFLSFSCVVATP